jgi:hypothetical protein
MTWGDTSASRAARRNRRIRGHGTWGEQNRRLHRFQQQKYRREEAGGPWENTSNSLGIRENRRIRGHGTWSAQTRRLDKDRRRRERGRQRSGVLGKAGSAVSVGALVLGVVLLMAPDTRGAGVMMLVVVGLALYVISGRKRA